MPRALAEPDQKELPMESKDCSPDQLEEIRQIYNEVIRTSTALYEYEPRSRERMELWWTDKAKAGIPVLGLFAGPELAGFATWGPFRSSPAYSHTVEHSVYVKDSWRGQGLGRSLLQALEPRAAAWGAHLMVGVIDADNLASRRLHEQCGFALAGTLQQCGYKFERWLDVVFYQKILTMHYHSN